MRRFALLHRFLPTSSMSRIALASLTALGGVAMLRAGEEPTKPDPKPGHSAHGESFDEGPRRAAYLMKNVGDVHLAVTTKSSAAQQFVDQGVAQLHGFWYLEAERSFRQAAAFDPDCPMSYWGMAMANIKNAKRAKAFIIEGDRRLKMNGGTDLEKAWIGLIHNFYNSEEKDEKKRKKALVAGLKKMREQFPNDIELKAFSAFFIWEYRETGEYKTAGKLLDEVFSSDADHPAHHYRIHLLDDRDSKGALPSSAANGPAAPGIAHMWHMPSHTYSDLRRYADATWSQEASARVDHAYMIRDRVMPYEIHNYAHNNEWLIRDLVYVGRVAHAIDLAKNMIELPRHPKFNESSNRGSGNEYGRTRLIDVLAQHELWAEYLALCDGPYLPDEGEGEQQIRKLRYQGVANAAIGKEADAKQAISRLKAMKAKSATQPTTKPSRASALTGNSSATKPAAVAAPASRPSPRNVAATQPSRPDVTSIDRAISHIEGQLALKAGRTADALKLLTAADLRKEVLARVHLAAGDAKKAIELAKGAVETNANETYPLAHQVLVLHEAGKKDDAAKAFAKLRDLSADVDLKFEPYKSVSAIAESYGFGHDWRKPLEVAKDVGERPPLDSLGPFRWSPPVAPTFSAPGADGRTISLDDYRGKPVVVIFYLGHGCLHCVQQLHAFGPMTKQFADAGISLVAISTDKPDALNRAWDSAKLDGGVFPFPLAADPELKLFKRFGCHDDFEEMPIHGTFLIDGAGKIRWQDISAEPFMDAKFLLGEAKRLLRQ